MAEQSYWERMRAGYRAKKERERNPQPPVVIVQPKSRPLRPDEWEDCGYANGWGESPPERVYKCTHQPPSRKVGQCLREVSCPVCLYTYKVDSGD